jgi:hypothetical protein
MKFISTKELRLGMPRLRKNLAKGEEFLLIFNSKPIAKIVPFQNGILEATDEDIELTALLDAEDDDYLSKKELNYYLSLK